MTQPGETRTPNSLQASLDALNAITQNGSMAPKPFIAGAGLGAGGLAGGAGISADEYAKLSELIEKMCGIAVGENKQYLLENRLAKLVAEKGCASFSEFYQLAKAGTDVSLKLKIVDAMTTKETLWFRDEHPFETLQQDIFPKLQEKRKLTGKQLRFWSAACSTGQEPYTLAMCAHEVAHRTADPSLIAGGLSIKATDIAPTSIMLSKLGRYDQLSMSRGLSEERKNKHFTQQGHAWSVNPEVKKLIEFEAFNLQDDPTKLGRFDVIFIRNVAIYFSKEFKTQLFTKLAKVLEPDGYLILGATESLVGLDTPFIPERLGKSMVYRLK